MAVPTKGKSAAVAVLPTGPPTDTQPGRDPHGLTPQVIRDIEQALGDVGRGADFPMSRSRGGSTSTRSSATAVPPPPTRPPPAPPVPAEYRLLTRVPDAQAGDTLTVARTRPSRSRGATAPSSARQPGSLAPIQEGHWDHTQLPLPPLPPLTLIPAPTAAPAPAPPATPWLAQEEWHHQEVSRQRAQTETTRPRAARTPSNPTQKAVTYSLFPTIRPLPVRSLPVLPAPPLRQFSSSSVTPSDVSRSSTSGWSNEFSQPLQSEHLDPDSPYGYPPPPPFLHNWETPNRTAARHSKDPVGAHRAGHTGPPIGSRPRPISIAPPPPPPPSKTRDSTAIATGQFTYYPMMSPYEAEAALGGVGLGIYHPYSQSQNDGEDVEPQVHARMFPLLDHGLMSAEQAATAVASATGVRNTIFIDRGVDVTVTGVNRSSSCYGDGEGFGDATM